MVLLWPVRSVSVYMRTLSHIRRWQSTHEQNKYYVMFCYHNDVILLSGKYKNHFPLILWNKIINLAYQCLELHIRMKWQIDFFGLLLTHDKSITISVDVYQLGFLLYQIWCVHLYFLIKMTWIQVESLIVLCANRFHTWNNNFFFILSTTWYHHIQLFL